MTLVWAPGYNGITDPDAQTYLAAVEAADGQAIEGGVALAINDFVVGCKLDGIWDAIKASCILAGARTLSGALVPLVGTAPDRQGTEGGWNYNRETGLKGNGTDNYLNSNRAGNADPQNNAHASIFVAESHSSTRAYIGSQSAGSPFNISNQFIYTAVGQINFRSRSPNVNDLRGSESQTGFIGLSRSSAATQNPRYGGTTYSTALTSVSPGSENYFVFANNSLGTPNFNSNSRLSFYSIGESLDLALLDNRVSTLMTDIGAAIP